MSVAEAARLVVADRRGGGHAGRVGQRVPRARRERVEAVLGRHDVVRPHLVLRARLGGALEARPQRRDERDQREPDHQRAGGPGRARGVARGVVLGQRTRQLRRAARPVRPTAAASGRTRRDEIMPTPMNSRMHPTRPARATAPVGRPPRTGRAPAAQPLSRARSARRCGSWRAATAAALAPSRTAAIGGTRVARRAGEIVASTVMPTPSSSETITVFALNTVPVRRQVDPERLEHRVQTLGDQQADRTDRRSPRTAR